MKKIKYFAYAGAIALLSVMVFTACSSSDEAAVEPGPNYNSEANEVVAQFVFNVSTGNTPTMRMSSAVTQATNTETFRGIDKALLFSFKQSADGKHLATAGTATKRYDMDLIASQGSIDKDHSRRIIEASLPLNTNAMLFYGKAPELYSTDAYETYGHLDQYDFPAASADGTYDLSTATIALGQRLTTDLQVPYHKTEDLLAGILTVVMNTNLAGTNHVAIPADGHPADAAHPTGNADVKPYKFAVATTKYNEVSWKDLYVATTTDGNSPIHVATTTEPTHPMTQLELKLAHIYQEMTNIQQGTGELRSGSAPALLLTIHDLWTNVNEVRCAEPTNECEAVAKFLAARISTMLEKFFTYTYLSTDGHGLEGVAYKSISDIVTGLNGSEWPAGSEHSAFADFEANLNGFPEAYHIPFGATHLRFDPAKSQFSYVKDFNTSLMDDTDNPNAVTVENYCYPAELLYFGNSPLRVTNSEKTTEQYPNGVANWDDADSWSTDWSVGHVVSTTHAVALKNNINYGTSLMKTVVKYGSDKLEDNNHAIQVAKHGSAVGDDDEPNKVIDVTDETFKLTGIIIGGQVKRVGWDFIAKSGAKYGAYVYDRDIQDGGIIPAYGDESDPTYTLLFDNYIEAEHQNKVYVALEFLNNSGQDFFGQHNLIRKNTHFYLIGELDPEKTGLNTIVWPENYPLPPYNADGTTITTPRVFIQDFMTSANFVIGAKSLQSALLTVPDLRYSSLTLGLSVDINWSTGLNFNEIVLGGGSN